MSWQHRGKLKLDEVGFWSEIKLEIIKDYAKAYSTILAAQKRPRFHHVYIDAFAGPGVHKSKSTGEEIAGSPLIAVNTQPPFMEYHFIDLNGLKVNSLRRLFGGRTDIHIHHGDCNRILLEKVLPRVQWRDYRRGLCLLDPYGLHLNWEVIRTIGEMQTVDMFLNFPMMDMNMNVLWRSAEKVDSEHIARMNAFWVTNPGERRPTSQCQPCLVQKTRNPTTRLLPKRSASVFGNLQASETCLNLYRCVTQRAQRFTTSFLRPLNRLHRTSLQTFSPSIETGEPPDPSRLPQPGCSGGLHTQAAGPHE
jgi:three-Cys-motif partner protein